MNEIIFLIEDAPEGGFTAKSLGHSIYTDAETLTELHANLRDAVACHFEASEKPSMIRLHFVRDEVIAA
jgi:predicted RNase H-like HicB family nuclease